MLVKFNGWDIFEVSQLFPHKMTAEFDDLGSVNIEFEDHLTYELSCSEWSLIENL